MTGTLSIMYKRNHGLTLLLLLLVSHVSSRHYHIVANDSISLCQSYSAGTCFTLAQFAQINSHLDQDNNVTLRFLPGVHLLTERLTVNGSQNITLSGQNHSNNLSTIKCQGNSGFEFTDIQSLNIAHLRFSDCGNVKYGGAIFISRADNLLIRGCHFINNHVTGDFSKGGAIYAEYTVAVNITDSYLYNNSAPYNYSEHDTAISVIEGIGYGGAILVVFGNISSIGNQYTNNSAGYGGVIYVEFGNLSSTSDYYINNSAGYGGVILLGSGNIYSTSNHYINNSADDNGGAIHIDYGDICSIGDYYIDNSAGYDGVILLGSGNIYSTSNHYMNNKADRGGAIFVVSGNVSTL